MEIYRSRILSLQGLGPEQEWKEGQLVIDHSVLGIAMTICCSYASGEDEKRIHKGTATRYLLI